MVVRLVVLVVLFFPDKLKTLPAAFFFQALIFQLIISENPETWLVRGLLKFQFH